MEVGISSRAPLLLNGGGNGIVKSKGIGNGSGVGVGAHPMRHHHIGIKVRRRSLCYVVVVVTPPVLRRNRNRAFLPSKVAASLPPPRAEPSAHCPSLQIEIMREWPCFVSKHAEV